MVIEWREITGPANCPSKICQGPGWDMMGSWLDGDGTRWGVNIPQYLISRSNATANVGEGAATFLT